MVTLTPADIAFEEAHINQNRGPALVGVSALFVVLCTFAIIGRVYARILLRNAFEIDDYLALVALVLVIGLAAEMIIIVHYGIGKHVVTLTAASGVTIGKGTFALEVTYTILVATTKYSVLMLYRRIFTMLNNIFRIGWWFMFTFTFAWFLLTIGITLFECTPISTVWSVVNQCKPTFTLSILAGAFNAVTDLGILLLPIPVVWVLHLPKQQRLATIGIFLLGSFVIIVSCVRVPSLKSAVQSPDGTFAEVPGLIWTITEPSVGLICACLPTLTPIFRRIANKRVGGTTKPSTNGSWSGTRTGHHGHQWNTIRGGEDERPINNHDDDMPGIIVQHDIESSYSMSNLAPPHVSKDGARAEIL